MRARWVAMGLTVAAAQGWAHRAMAQDAQAYERLQRMLDDNERSRQVGAANLELSESGRLLLGGYTTFGFAASDDAGSNTRILRQSDTKLWADFTMRGHQAYGRLRFNYLDFNSGDSFDGRGDNLDEPIGDRYWYRFDYRAARMADTGERSDDNFWFQGGRQFVNWGSGLTLSEDLYAARAGLELHNLDVQGLIGQTPSTGPVDFDSSRPGYDSDVDRGFVGVMFTFTGLDRHRPYFFFLDQQDRNERDSRTILLLGTPYPTEYEYDSSYLGLGTSGELSSEIFYQTEFVYEYGQSLSSSISAAGLPVPQTEESIRAWAANARLIYSPRWGRPNGVRFDWEALLASGDSDRQHTSNTFGGNQSGTKDRAFNALGYANTGLVLGPNFSNLLSFRLGASTMPWRGQGIFDKMRLGVDGYLLSKLDSDAPVSFTTERGERFLGAEVDLFLDWQIYSDLSLDLRYGLFIPGDAMPEGSDDERHFFYAGLNYAF
jgi:hypothetical protein